MAVVTDLRPTETGRLIGAIDEAIDSCETDGGTVTGYAFIVFANDGEGRRGSLMKFRVDDIVEATGAVEILKHSMISFHESEDGDDSSNGAA